MKSALLISILLSGCASVPQEERDPLYKGLFAATYTGAALTAVGVAAPYIAIPVVLVGAGVQTAAEK